MSCWGGLVDLQTAIDLPVLTIGSGPAAGVVGAQLLAKDRHPNVITTDMGGTTFDVALVLEGNPVRRKTSKFDQFEYAVPTLDVRSLGAGGGSIVEFDQGRGTLRVGPRSAGARPGPAAFGRGGLEATVTDADLVVGYLNADNFLGGAMQLDLDAARHALGKAGSSLGLDAEQTAAAAVRIVDNHMADEIRLVSVQQGRDPRQLTLYAYGGNGPVHASALAQGLGISRVIVPLGDLASGWSAFGVAASDAVIVEETHAAMVHPFDPDALNAMWEELEDRVFERLLVHDLKRDEVRSRDEVLRPGDPGAGRGARR